jgi:hypothetical protein
MKSTAYIIGSIFGLIWVYTIIVSLPVQLLWNWLMPKIFGLTTITFWEALGLVLLSNLLIKSHRVNDNNKK